MRLWRCGLQALWLGVEPPDLLLYVFLPPILLDSAARIDFFVFKKARARPRVPLRRPPGAAPATPARPRGEARTVCSACAGGGQLTGQGLDGP